MSKSPLISVVMPVYDDEQFLNRAIDSILSQTYTNFEFIIIDDGSNTKTKNIINSYTDERLRIITHDINEGIVRSLNDGILAAKGKYIARMDADDISRKDRFEKQVYILKKNRGYAVLGSFTNIVSSNQKLLFTIEQPTRDEAIKNFMLHDSCIAHGSAMMIREAVVKVGMYSNKKYVMHAEDYDIFVKLAKQYKVANYPEYLYTRHEHRTSISHKFASIQATSTAYIRKKARESIEIKKPAFSVLMPAHNSEKYIGLAIESVINQSFQDWELIIIDDGSTDDTKEVVKQYLKDKRIIYLENPKNLGKAKTRNRLVKESIADIFGELDSDDVLENTALETMYKAHNSHPKYGFIYSQFVFCDKNLKKGKLGFCRKPKSGETNLHNVSATAFRTYKRFAYDKTSGFDVNLNGAEDIDLIYKIEEMTKILFVNKPLYLYRKVAKVKNRSTTYGLIAHIKAKIYAYIRRRGNGYNNIRLTTLLRQVTNLGIEIVKS